MTREEALSLVIAHVPARSASLPRVKRAIEILERGKDPDAPLAWYEFDADLDEERTDPITKDFVPEGRADRNVVRSREGSADGGRGWWQGSDRDRMSNDCPPAPSARTNDRWRPRQGMPGVRGDAFAAKWEVPGMRGRGGDQLMPHAKNGTLPMPRRSFTPTDSADRATARMSYRLEQWSDAKQKWVCLAGYAVIDKALEDGPRRSGDVKLVRKSGETVVRWLNGTEVKGGE